MKKCPIDGRTLLVFNEVKIKDGLICTHCRNEIGLASSDNDYYQICQSLTVAKVQNLIANNSTLDLQKIHKEKEEKQQAKIAAQEEKQRLADQRQREKLNWLKIGDLTEIAHGTNKVILHKNEYVFYEVTGDVPWYEERIHTERSGYSGMGVSFRVAKGIYIHSGRSYPRTKKYTQNEIVHSGEILLTNKRLLLAGSNDSAQINLSSIVNVTPYTDGITIQKSRGKDVTLGDFDGEELAILLTRLVSKDLYAHSSYENPNNTPSKASIDNLVQNLSKDFIVRKNEQQHVLDIVVELDISELKSIYLYTYEKYNDTIEAITNNACDAVQSFENNANITGYIIKFYADKDFKNLTFQFRDGQMEYSLFTDLKFINYLNDIDNKTD
ncbi:CheF family chemotaxis protein [Lentilactobacillus kisonensis]|uniref:DUF4428 domain-containing protein n=1 Tax=Lentilactobacillus kisonensis F0435 TaxID=797516 RepID=H1LF26_9LACO|nr:CheF family chemotaxis protein [Lentilactobacillus kisonensis]EHO52265.1 hypothetical protein HMPREF9104_01202 [Lentilactobacillus kisonensis F0435]